MRLDQVRDPQVTSLHVLWQREQFRLDGIVERFDCPGHI